MVAWRVHVLMEFLHAEHVDGQDSSFSAQEVKALLCKCLELKWRGMSIRCDEQRSKGQLRTGSKSVPQLGLGQV